MLASDSAASLKPADKTVHRRLAVVATWVAVATVVCFGQYLFFSVRNHVAPTPTGELAGTWVGSVGQTRLDLQRWNLPPNGGSHYGVQVTLQTQLWSGDRERMKGKLSVCSRTGAVSSGEFDDVWVLEPEHLAPFEAKHWTGSLTFDALSLRLPGADNSPFPEDNLHTEGYRLTAFTYGDPPVKEGNEDVIGTLRHGTAADFQALCRSLRR